MAERRRCCCCCCVLRRLFYTELPQCAYDPLLCTLFLHAGQVSWWHGVRVSLTWTASVLVGSFISLSPTRGAGHSLTSPGEAIPGVRTHHSPLCQRGTDWLWSFIGSLLCVWLLERIGEHITTVQVSEWRVQPVLSIEEEEENIHTGTQMKRIVDSPLILLGASKVTVPGVK